MKFDWVKLGLILFFFSCLLRMTASPTGGHVHRQSDTIGMSVAFANEIKSRGVAALEFLAYPKILQSGLSKGPVASEFPLTNLLTGPFFLLRNPQMGIILGSFLILVLNLGVAGLVFPEFLSYFGLTIRPTLSMLLWFTGSTLSIQTYEIMPEGVGFPLSILGLTLVLSNRAKILGIFLLNIAIASKPTLVVVLPVVFLLPNFFHELRNNPKENTKRLATLAISLIFPIYWYVFHNPYIFNHSDAPQIFKQAALNPIKNLKELGWEGLFALIVREPNEGQFPNFLGLIILGLGLYMRQWLTIIVYLVMIVFVGALDGRHGLIHSYYFIGLAIYAMLLMAKLSENFETIKQRWIPRVWVGFLMWGLLFNIRTNIWFWARTTDLG